MARIKLSSQVRALYPFESHYLDLGGIGYHYIDEGSGSPVLMLHGNPSWSFYYRRLVTALRRTHRVIVPDHIGCGLSDVPDEAKYQYTLSRRVADLERLVEHLQLSNITLVVHDWGGMIGFALATRRPDLFARFVVLNTGAFHLPEGMRLPWQIRMSRTPVIGPVLIRGLSAFSRGAVRTCVTRRPLAPAEAEGLCAPYDNWAHRLAVLRFIEDIPMKHGDAAYSEVQRTQENLHVLRDKPMLICWGKRDFVFNDGFLAQWRTHFPNADVHTFDDAGHYVLEDAHEQIVPLVEQLLAAEART